MIKYILTLTLCLLLLSCTSATPPPTPTVEAVPPTALPTSTTEMAMPEAVPADPNCPVRDNHPRSEELASRYEITDDEIMGWFCAGFGFGDINQAYRIANETEASVPQLLGAVQVGLSWEQIATVMGVSPIDPYDSEE